MMCFITASGRGPGAVSFIDTNAKYYHKNDCEMSPENT